MMNSVSEAEVNQYKKKKKRRQLDALVKHMKLPRGRKNSGHELLDYQSGSSEFEEFSVAARSPTRKKSCLCDIIVAKVVYFILSVTCISICVGLIWVQWQIRQDLNSLKDRVTTVEQSDAFIPDSMTKFQTQLVSLNKSLTEVRSGTGGIKTLAASIDDLKNKVKDFEEVSVELKKAVASSKDLFDMPKKLEDLTTVIANMKNDVNAAASINSKQEELENRLNALENDLKATKSSNKEGSEMTKSDNQKSLELIEQVNQLNQTMIENVASIKSRLDQQEAKMSTMEEFIDKSASSSPVDASVINKLIKDTMQEYMGNLTSSASLPAGELEGVLKQVEGMVQMIQKFKTDQDNIVTKGEFLVFKDDVMDDFKNVNESITTFNDEFEEVFNHVKLLELHMNNITSSNQAIVSPKEKENLTSPSGSDEPSQSNESKGTTQSHLMTTLSSTQKSTTGGPDADRSNENTPTPQMTEKPKRTENGGEENTNSEPEPSPAGNELERTIQIENITNLHDLVEAFKKIKPAMAPMNEKELTAFLGGKTITSEQMEAMDTNHDGMFGVMEISKIIAYVPPPRKSSPPSS